MDDPLARTSVLRAQRSIPPQAVQNREFISPKRPAVETSGLADIFPYYAGFSYDWAYGQIQAHCPSEESIVLDPWNGSGTATIAARSSGHRAIGVDLNPVANIVSNLRCRVANSAQQCNTPERSSRHAGINQKVDPLANWFTPSVVRRVRDWTLTLGQMPIEVSTLGRVAVFRAVRKLTASFEGTNPTWVKRAKTSDDLVSCSRDALDDAIDTEQRFLLERLNSTTIDGAMPIILTASSGSLPLKDHSVDFVITSPPYLTRIDYGVAYSRELAVLGVDISNDRALRTALMGTTIIRQGSSRLLDTGPIANELLSRIANHESHASGVYYLKQARQYLRDLTAGLDELTRVAKSGAGFCFAVQDSFYKEIPVPLADIAIEEAGRRGWALESCERFPVKRSLTTMNSLARKYAKGDVSESVIRVRLR